ncbi:MAG: 16S rRNA (cytosine(1402)-N(4))-methyltransferase RsmH [Parcubacteria group bacterium]|nr:16S rRNA (cytosine(1402)-N(4))-methyltransferase RsmH [Parcubacteria group bacterium]
MSIHTPVLLNEVVEILNPLPNQDFIDATLGGGGYTRAILERTAPRGKVLAIDASSEAIEQFEKNKEIVAKPRFVANVRERERDEEQRRSDINKKDTARRSDEVAAALSNMEQKSGFGNYLLERAMSERVILVNDNFSRIAEIIEQYDFKNFYGIVADLGLSKDLLETSGRGFSFQRNEPLDMRYESEGITAADIVNTWRREKLEKIFREYGEEWQARRYVEAIAKARRERSINTTFDLIEIVRRVTPIQRVRHIHFATKIFQALRIAVNDELTVLQKFLERASALLPPRAHIAIIAYHSLEDRIVKQFFKQETSLHQLTFKPITPTEAEIENNASSRSAKLRVAMRIGNKINQNAK